MKGNEKIKIQIQQKQIVSVLKNNLNCDFITIY